MEPDADPPIFVVGVPRSGTTLMRMVLDSHPDVACGPEAPWIAGRAADDAPNVTRLVAYLREDPWGIVHAYDGVPEEAVVEEAARFVDRLLTRAARAQGASRWAEKTPEHLLHLDTLPMLFPTARFVHVVRDGRDVAASATRTDWGALPMPGRKVRNHYLNALRMWTTWLEASRPHREALGDRLLEVRYEDLVTEPERWLRRVAKHARLPWDDAMLHPHEEEHAVRSTGGEGVGSFHEHTGISSDGAHRWRREGLPAHRALLARWIAGDTLEAWGYPATPRPWG